MEDREKRDALCPEAPIPQYRNSDPFRSYPFRCRIGGRGGEILIARAVSGAIPPHSNIHRPPNEGRREMHFVFQILTLRTL